MISDDERREVARRLRETGEELGSAALLWYHIAKALGVRTATDGETACDMLADLIEPSYSATTPHCSADSDALLELADEFDAQGDYIAHVIEDSDGDFDRHAIDEMEERYGYARRIREACGVKS